MKSLKTQFCHFESQNILAQSIMKDHLGDVSSPSFYAFILRQKCRGIPLKKGEDSYAFRTGFVATSSSLTLPLEGEL